MAQSNQTPPATPFEQVKHHVRNRMLIGLLILTPFAMTVWIIVLIAGFFTGIITRPITFVATSMGAGRYVQYLVMVASLVLIVLLIYALGLISTTILGRRFIAAGERLLRRIPGGEFLYNTIKQIIDLVSLARASSLAQRVVMIEFPRKGVFSIAFYSGLTTMADTGETMVNVFYATTPNPTSGFLMLMKPSEVWETNITFAEGTRFIMSGGVVSPEDLKTRPFPIEEYLTERRNQAAKSAVSKDSLQKGL